MSEAAAQVEVPPAEQPPEPSQPKRFADRFETKLAELEGAPKLRKPPQPVQPEKGTAEPEKPAAPAPEKPAPDAREAELGQLKSLAVKLGFKFDDAAVTVADRADWRQAKARQEAALKAERDKLEKERAEFSTTHAERLKKAEALTDALERNDPDAYAQAAGFKDWNDFNGSWLQRLSDPNYKEMARIRKELDERKAKEEKDAKEAEERKEGETKAQARRQYMQSLSEQCKASANPIAQAMAEDPVFLNDVFRIQSENWDEERQQTCTVEEAIERSTRGGKFTIKDTLRALKERLDKAFPNEAAAVAAETAKPGKKPAPKTAVTPVNTTPGSGAPKTPGQMSKEEWRAYARKRLEEATED